MMLTPFVVSSTAVLTSTTSSQSVTFPASGQTNQIVVYNGGANPVYVAKAATVAIPSGAPALNDPQVLCIAPSTTQPFTVPMNGGTLSYVAATAGGALVIMTGNGF